MTHINKQRFLTELSKFLTFLSDEEREQVLMKFSDIFDAAPNQDELVSALVSPLKVTVELSRAYGKGGIEKALERAVELSGVDMSAAPAPVPAAPEAPADIYESIGSAVESAFDSGTDAPQNEAPAEAPAAAEAPAESVPAEEPATEAQSPVQAESVPAEMAAEETAPAAEEPAASAEKPQPAADTKRIDEPKPVLQRPEAPKSAPEAKKDEQKKAPKLVPVNPDSGEFIDTEPEEFFDGSESGPEEPVPATEYKSRPLALALFIIIFVPLGIVGIALLLCVGAAIIAAAAAAVGSGVFAFSLAFSGMAIFADIIMTIGAALVCFALGVVLMWLGVWFLIWSIGGLVRGILKLGKKWGYKEVQAK